MGCGSSTPGTVVAINGEGEAATENGQETVVEDAKVNGNGVHGEPLPGTVTDDKDDKEDSDEKEAKEDKDDNPLDPVLDPLPPIKAVSQPLEEAVGSRPKTSNPNFRDPKKLPRLISGSGSAAKYRPETGDTVQEE